MVAGIVSGLAMLVVAAAVVWVVARIPRRKPCDIRGPHRWGGYEAGEHCLDCGLSRPEYDQSNYVREPM